MGGSENQRGRVSVVTAAATLPLSVDDVKAHLRIDHDDDDTELAVMIAAEKNEVEQWLGQSIISQTLRLTFDCPPPRVIKLPRPPVTSVVTIKVRTSDDEWVTVYDATDDEDIQDDVDLHQDLTAKPGLIWPGDAGWPTDFAVGPDIMRIEYVAGYTDESVPAHFKARLLAGVGNQYLLREGVVIGTIVANLKHFDRMLDSDRVYA